MPCRFFPTGAFYHAVGDMHGPSKATVCRVVRKVANLINQQLRGAIKWPTTHLEHANESRGFYDMAGVPDVIGEYALGSIAGFPIADISQAVIC